jgi:protein-S-isoprenylcysteine O-methyltransferase Ste14
MLAYLILAIGIPSFLKFSVSSFFPNGIDELVCALLYFGFWYFEFVNQVFVTIKNKQSILEIKNDKLSLLVIYLGFFVASYAAGWVAGLRFVNHFGALPVWTFYIGLALMAIGVFVREWSIYTLGRYFTFPVMIVKDQKLIIKGPYRFVRHPGYLAGALLFGGLALALQSWAAPIVVIVVLIPTYAYRIHLEEYALIKKFGKEYENYMKRTAMIIPYLI